MTGLKQLDTIQTEGNLNDVFRYGEPGPGGAYHDYVVACYRGPEEGMPLLNIEFQKGPRKDPDARHGVLDCDLLEIVRDRLKAFQSGPMASNYNAVALFHVERALEQMNERVRDRMQREVLGTMEK